MAQRLEFVASLTVSPSDIRKVLAHIEQAEVVTDPLNNLLVTPLFVSPISLGLIRELSDAGRTVFFDSGGYYVQMGRLRYHELYIPLLNVYKANPWASVYTLPDHVPLTQDKPEEVDRKVSDTIAFSSLFFQELPDDLKPRAMPVVQGHTYKHVDACLEAYIKLGVRRVGFGSFGTVGANSEVNVATNDAIGLAKYVVEIANTHGIKVHAFGLGVPALVAMLKGIGVNSFDSASWLKSAGFGQVYLPFMRAYNISYKYTVSEIQKGVTFEQFSDWQQLTGHWCPYCDSLEKLRLYKMYRATHNLIVIAESVGMINQGMNERIRAIYASGSKKYRNEYERWLMPS